MPHFSRSVKFPRPPRLHPVGVTFEPLPVTDHVSWLTVRTNGTPSPDDETKVFKFQKAITSKP